MSICSHNTFIINVIIGIVNNENIVDIATTFAPYLLSKFIFATNNIVDAAEGHEQAIIVAKDTISPSPNHDVTPIILRTKIIINGNTIVLKIAALYILKSLNNSFIFMLDKNTPIIIIAKGVFIDAKRLIDYPMKEGTYICVRYNNIPTRNPIVPGFISIFFKLKLPFLLKVITPLVQKKTLKIPANAVP